MASDLAVKAASDIWFEHRFDRLAETLDEYFDLVRQEEARKNVALAERGQGCVCQPRVSKQTRRRGGATTGVRGEGEAEVPYKAGRCVK